MNKIYVVSTPIGNIKDMTQRAIEVLQEVSYIFAEDTRHSSLLLSNYDIKTKMISLHKFNEKSRSGQIKEKLLEGDIAIISDAGTPTINDPGQFILNELCNEYEVVSVPGASAVTAALSISGLVFDSFSFIGFMPKTEEHIKKIIKKNINVDVIVSYETSKRINSTLKKLSQIDKNIEVVVCREITKMYEEVTRGKAIDLKDKEYRGEIVLLIKTIDPEDNELDSKIEFLKETMNSNKDIVKYLVDYEGKNKNIIYKKVNNE